jgi:hypothetical protein
VYRWIRSLLADHEHDPPRITAYRPDHVVPGRELGYLSEGFADAPDDVAAVLRRRAENLRRHLTAESDPGDCRTASRHHRVGHAVGALSRHQRIDCLPRDPEQATVLARSRSSDSSSSFAAAGMPGDGQCLFDSN